DAAGRAADLTRQLLGFARKQTAQPRVLDVQRTIVPMLDMLRRVIGEHITLDAEFTPETWPVRIDPTQLDQVLTNLVVNARDAITGSGRITVRVANATLQDSEVPQHRGEWVVLTVTDTGKGMSKETLERAFEPFFTTKPEGQGTGLGLATVYGIVDQNGGFIDVASKPGHGAAFNIHLPRHAGLPTTREAPRVTGTPTSDTPRVDTVLVVEDDALLRALIERLLRQAGYTVRSAPSGPAALDLTDLDTIDLLVTDVIMPGMNGHELFAELSMRHPGLRCLYVSGYPRDVLATQGLVPLDVALLPKPFSHDALVRKVAELIAR
ncbi:MAG TPA: ATP-binding protein, partial [Myxococcota bacterium]|nr:ATP-binding protein [Myxococcota bacterium]